MRTLAASLALCLALASFPAWVQAADVIEGPVEGPRTPLVTPLPTPLPSSALPLEGTNTAPPTGLPEGLSASSARVEPVDNARPTAASASAPAQAASAQASAARAKAPSALARVAAVFAQSARLAVSGGQNAPSAGETKESPELQASKGSEAFDGAVKSRGERFAAAVGFGAGSLARRVLGKSAAARLVAKKEKIPTPYDKDPYGGPQYQKLSFRQRVAAGAREGLRLAGLATLLDWTVRPFMDAMPWQLWVHHHLLNAAGRVELLTRFGPSEIASGLQGSPLSFIFTQVGPASVYEEIVFRVLTLGSVFIFVNVLAAAARSLSGWLGKVPDLFELRAVSQRALNLAARVSSKAFPIAAAWSTCSFVTSHFENWGIDPYTMLVNGVLGLALARLAYKTRGLTAPATAHFVYNALSLSVLAVALHFSTLAALGYTLLYTAGSLAYLFWSWRAARKDKKAALAQAKRDWLSKGGIAAVLALALGLGAATQGLKPESAVSFGKNAPAKIELLQDKNVKRLPVDTVAPVDTASPAENKTAEAKPQESAAPLAADWAVDVAAKAEPAIALVELPDGLGSGFIVSPQGLLVTNAHVAGEAGLGGIVQVVFSSGLKVPGKVVGLNREKDIALVALPKRVDGSPWPVLPIRADVPKKGEPVITMGNPHGLRFSVSEGIVSGIGGDGRSSPYVDYVQTDAAINPGNSGGPLIDRHGAVVGINTWIYAQAQNLGFSISAPDLIASLQQFVATGRINSAYLGLIFNTNEPDEPDAGVRVEVVRPGSPAHSAGIRADDVILSVNGRKLSEDSGEALKQLTLGLARSKSGDKLSLGVSRGEKVLTLTVTLGNKPE